MLWLLNPLSLEGLRKPEVNKLRPEFFFFFFFFSYTPDQEILDFIQI